MAEKGAVMDQAMKAYLGDVPQISYNFKKPKEARVSLKRKAIRIILNIRIHTKWKDYTCYITNWHSTPELQDTSHTLIRPCTHTS